MDRQVQHPGHAHQAQRQQLRHHGRIADPRPRPHAPIVRRRQGAEKQRDDRQSRQRLGRRRPEFPQVDDEQIHPGGARRQATEQHQPTHLQAREPSERVAHIQIGAAGLGELGRDLGVTGDDDHHARAGDQHGRRTRAPEQSRNHRGQSEDAAAEDAVDRECYHAPAADCADQLRLRGARRLVRHRALVSQAGNQDRRP